MTLKPWFIFALVGISVAMMSLQFKADLDAPSFVWGLTPMYAAGLLFGARLSRPLAITLLVAIQLVGASLIGWLSGHWEWAFYGWGQILNVGALLTTALLGRLILGRRHSVPSRVCGGVAAAISFFLISNLGTWALPPAEFAMYPKTFSGLMDCYFMGLPHLRLTITACVGYSLVFFSPRFLAAVSNEPVGTKTAVSEAAVS